MVRGIRERLTTRDARAVVELVRSALDSAPDTWPQLPTGGRNEPNVDVEVEMLTAIVRMRARENNIALPTLASSADLTAIARGHRAGVDVLKGWRKEIVGDELVSFLEGRTALSIEDGKPVVKPLS